MNQTQQFKNNKGKKIEQTQPSLFASQSFYQGQIPPPDMMEHYKTIDEDFPKRIIKMAGGGRLGIARKAKLQHGKCLSGHLTWEWFSPFFLY